VARTATGWPKVAATKGGADTLVTRRLPVREVLLPGRKIVLIATTSEARNDSACGPETAALQIGKAFPYRSAHQRPVGESIGKADDKRQQWEE
jgi:hypothetical protein